MEIGQDMDMGNEYDMDMTQLKHVTHILGKEPCGFGCTANFDTGKKRDTCYRTGWRWND